MSDEGPSLDSLAAGDTQDLVRPFAIEGLDIRGRIVRLGPALDQILTAHDYPEPVSRLLGEALLVLCQLAAGLKFEGKLSLQLRGNGPVSMLIADFFTPGTLRGYARHAAGTLPEEAGPIETGQVRVAPLLGEGVLTVVIDQGPDTERYQAVVALEGDTLTEVMAHYFIQSEQLATAFENRLARIVDAQGQETWVGGGLMLQHMPSSAKAPGTGEPASEAWNRSDLLLRTVETHELTDPTLPVDQLLYRLFHEDGVRVFESLPTMAGCRCRAETVETVLKSYGTEDLSDMVEDGVITVHCEFCKTAYRFDPATLDRLT
ncbi:MAG: Hsp33 family molecular chaperone HslO [Pseudomonadota bacterium]